MFKLSKFKITNKGLYWGLILTFALLYLCVGFVSTLHSITFFNLANTMGLAVLLGLTYEVGQASVLFSILMSEKNKGKFLPWALMVLLTALQVTANVYASFKFMANSGSTDYVYWQKSILFGVQAPNAEMYQVIISWIAGALLPIVALGMTALVAQNMTFMKDELEGEPAEKPKEDIVEKFLSHEFKKPEEKIEYPRDRVFYPDAEKEVMPSREEQLEKLKDKMLSNVGKQTKIEENPIIGEGGVKIIKPEFQSSLSSPQTIDPDGTVWSAQVIDPHLKPAESPFKTYDELMSIPIGGKVEEIVENEVKRRLQEKEAKKAHERNEQDVQEAYQNDLDRDVESLIPEIDLSLETRKVEAEVTQIPVDIIIEEEKPETVIPKEIQKQAGDAMRRELGEKIPFAKTRGWHLKKEYIDSNGDVYKFGKFQPEELKKA